MAIEQWAMKVTLNMSGLHIEIFLKIISNQSSSTCEL